MSDSIYATSMRTHACGELTAARAGAAGARCGGGGSRRGPRGGSVSALRARGGGVPVV